VTQGQQNPTRKDRFIARLVSFLTRSVYRKVEVYVPPDLPTTAPLLTVSNHFGGFADALVLLDVFPRRPGIVARDVIWKIPVAGRLMTWIGGIPVHKPEDRTAATSNDEMFGSCYAALADNGHILIFPEGVTRNEPSIAPVKTGAARIALGAQAHGVAKLAILPVGIHYEDKAALRSRVFVNVGLPIEVDDYVANEFDEGAVAGGANDREAVKVLTDSIETALRRAAPDYANWSEAHLLAAGADITLRNAVADSPRAVGIGLRDRLANTLADRPVEHRRQICDAVSAYQDDLDSVGFSDAELGGALDARRFTRSFLTQLFIGVLLLPFAFVGAVINVIPFLVVKAVGALRVAPSMLSTLKPIAAFAAFGITWCVVIWLSTMSFGWRGGVIAFVLLPVYLAAVVLSVERGALLWRLVRRRRAAAVQSTMSGQLLARRQAVVETVLAA